MIQIYVAGKILPAQEARVSVFDAGFQSGDAIWEGLRVSHGRVLRLEQHLARLEASAKALRSLFRSQPPRSPRQSRRR